MDFTSNEVWIVDLTAVCDLLCFLRIRLTTFFLTDRRISLFNPNESADMHISIHHPPPPPTPIEIDTERNPLKFIVLSSQNNPPGNPRGNCIDVSLQFTSISADCSLVSEDVVDANFMQISRTVIYLLSHFNNTP